MEPSCVQHSLIPGTSRLFCDYLYNFDRVKTFYPAHFSELGKLIESAKTVQFPDSRREPIVAALRKQNGDSPALAKLSQPGTVAVVTGQQVGLFSGPAYTIFKALTAVRLAEYLNQQGIAAVPIFWLATEDHDLAEVDHAWLFNQDAKPSKVSVTNTVTNGGPVGNVELSTVPLGELRDALGELPFADQVMDKIAAAYHPGVTLGNAFRAFLQDVLGDFGLLYLDPLAVEVREIAADFVRHAIDGVPELIAALRERNNELAAAGYHAQVLVEEDSSLFFLLTENRRTALRWKDGHFVTKERSYTTAELKAIADRVSPNALLRPVMQDYLLPTVGYVGGPAETAYLAQSEVLYRSLLGRMPVVFPRNSFTLLDERATKLLMRYNLHVADLFQHQERLKSEIAAKLVPRDLTGRLEGVRSDIASALGGLQQDLRHFDATLESAAKKSSAKILYQVDKLARKTAREALQRDERGTRDAAYLTNLVYPHRHLQERFYSIVPFLAKHGSDLPQKLLDETQLACPDHMIRTV